MAIKYNLKDLEFLFGEPPIMLSKDHGVCYKVLSNFGISVEFYVQREKVWIALECLEKHVFDAIVDKVTEFKKYDHSLIVMVDGKATLKITLANQLHVELIEDLDRFLYE